MSDTDKIRNILKSHIESMENEGGKEELTYVSPLLRYMGLGRRRPALGPPLVWPAPEIGIVEIFDTKFL
jgi:hypothetical protein